MNYILNKVNDKLIDLFELKKAKFTKQQVKNVDK